MTGAVSAAKQTNSSTMAEKPRDACVESAILRGWVSLRLNFRLRVTFRANVYGTLDGGMIVLQLCCWVLLHKEIL